MRQALESDSVLRVALTTADCWQAGREQLMAHHYDVVLLDLTLPDGSGSELIEHVLEASRDTPVVVLTADESVVLEALKSGAHDYLVKRPDLASVIGRVVRHAIERGQTLPALRVAQRRQLELKNQFVSNVSQELRTPLNGIQQYALLMLEGVGGRLSSDHREFAEILLESARQLRRMVDDLMDVTRAEAGTLTVDVQPVRIDEIVPRVFKDFTTQAADRGIELDWEPPMSLPDVMGDAERLRQILGNLIDNALKFTPRGSHVNVRAALDPDDPTFLRVSVADSGCGIAPERLPTVFDRLHETEQPRGEREDSRGGLGLGLHIARELITRQGGLIWAESELSKGSTFHFTLPILSFPRLLRPILIDTDGQIRTLVTLLSFAVGPRDPTASVHIDEGLLNTVYEVIQSCVLRDLDLVLPRIGRYSVGETFFVAAGTDSGGAAVIGKRITKALERAINLDRSSVRVEMHSRPLELSPPTSGEEFDEFVNRAGGELEKLVHRDLAGEP